MGENKSIKEAFDREAFIIDFLSRYDTDDILFFPDCHKTRRLWKNLLKTELWENNSNNTLTPPDFVSDILHCLLEVMQVDEYVVEKQIGKKVKRINPRKQKEAEWLLKLAKRGVLDTPENPVIALPSGKDLMGLEHNYEQYLQDFKTVIGKHNAKIPTYKHQREQYKTVFLVFDTSSLYMETYSFIPKENRKHGNRFLAKNFHYWFADRAFVDFIGSLDCDYLIWVTPFKDGFQIEYATAPIPRLPTVCIFDVKNCKNLTTKYYDPALTISTDDNTGPTPNT